MEFFDWNSLSNCAGCALAVGVITQITKEIPGIRVIPTQLWSYLLALATLILAQAFSAGFSLQGMVLTVFNAAVVALSANGGYSALERIGQGMPPDAQ